MTTRLKGAAPQLKVNVTKDCIDNGTERNSNHCMIAEAVKNARPNLSHVCVDIQTIRATNRKLGERYIWLTPKSAQQLIVDFDRGKRPTPFSVTLNAGQTVEVATMTAAHKEKKRAYAAAAAKKNRKARLIKNGRGNSIPHIHGGAQPPRSVGSRRSFGLRTLNV